MGTLCLEVFGLDVCKSVVDTWISCGQAGHVSVYHPFLQVRIFVLLFSLRTDKSIVILLKIQFQACFVLSLTFQWNCRNDETLTQCKRDKLMMDHLFFQELSWSCNSIVYCLLL